MEMYLFRYNEYIRINNCSVINISSIPLSERQNPIIGSIFLVISLIFQTLYLPCLISLHRHSANNVCYSLMRYLAIIDILVLPICGILSGILAIRGDVFCSNPALIYITGSFGLGFYCSVSLVSILLALNRCIELINPRLNEAIFSPNMLILWYVLASMYGAYFILFTVPIKFTSIYMSWFWSPYTGYSDKNAELFRNIMHEINNVFECVLLVGIYTIFCISLGIHSTMVSRINPSTNNTSNRNFQIRTFIQVFLISLTNVVACLVSYFLMKLTDVLFWVANFMNLIQINKSLIVIGQFSWICVHGLPPIIYLTLNRTIRHETLQMLKVTWKNVKEVRSRASGIVGIGN